MIKFKWNNLNKIMARVEQLPKELEGKLELNNREIAYLLVDDVRTHWTATAPSAAGQSPAKDLRVNTGNLDNSAVVEGRGSGGRFANRNLVAVYFVRWDTEKGGNAGKRGDYAPFLEFGTDRMAARPFLRPAVKRMQGHITAITKRNVR